MKCDELKEKIQITNDPRMVYLKSEVDAAIAELKEVYKDSVYVKVKIWERYKKEEDELRKTQRALWLARAKRAQEMAWNFHEKNLVEKCAKWDNVHLVLLAKAEEYR